MLQDGLRRLKLPLLPAHLVRTWRKAGRLPRAMLLLVRCPKHVEGTTFMHPLVDLQRPSAWLLTSSVFVWSSVFGFAGVNWSRPPGKLKG